MVGTPGVMDSVTEQPCGRMTGDTLLSLASPALLFFFYLAARYATGLRVPPSGADFALMLAGLDLAAMLTDGIPVTVSMWEQTFEVSRVAVFLFVLSAISLLVSLSTEAHLETHRCAEVARSRNWATRAFLPDLDPPLLRLALTWALLAVPLSLNAYLLINL